MGFDQPLEGAFVTPVHPRPAQSILLSVYIGVKLVERFDLGRGCVQRQCHVYHSGAGVI
jgi:hypothetical protein